MHKRAITRYQIDSVPGESQGPGIIMSLKKCFIDVVESKVLEWMRKANKN